MLLKLFGSFNELYMPHDKYYHVSNLQCHTFPDRYNYDEYGNAYLVDEYGQAYYPDHQQQHAATGAYEVNDVDVLPPEDAAPVHTRQQSALDISVLGELP